MADNFDECGPAYLINPSWEDADHRRIITASLVNGVSVLQRNGANALARKWWTFFHFQLEETLIDDCDGSVFGAVFQGSGEEPAKQQKPAPRVVVAFRGTIMSCVMDLITDLQILVNRLEKRSRYLKGLEALRNSVRSHGPKHVVIAGHSMGAAIGLLAGRTLMAKDGVNLEAHLFNPPCPYLEKDVIQKVVKGNDEYSEIHSKFLAVKDWVPYLYVNQQDIICRFYIEYFSVFDVCQSKRYALSSALDISQICSQGDMQSRKYAVNEICSQGDILSALGDISFSLLDKQSWPWHLIPSANLILSTSMEVALSLLDSHKLCQWWRNDIHTQIRYCTLLSNAERQTLTTLDENSRC